MALENQIITVLRLSIGTLSTSEAKKKKRKEKSGWWGYPGFGLIGKAQTLTDC